MANGYTCSECGYQSEKWFNMCPGCNSWNTASENKIIDTEKEKVSEPPDRWVIKNKSSLPTPISKVVCLKENRMSTGIAEFDRVLGGGVVKGSISLLGGSPGIGKSTILMQTAFNISKHHNVMYASSEENESQLKIRCDRLRCLSDNIYVLYESNIDEVVKYIDTINPSLLIIDSIQTAYCEYNSASVGSTGQIKEVTMQLFHLAKTRNISVILIGHVTKDGSIAGPKLLEHMVDTVLYFEEDYGNNAYRIIRAVKNRFGRGGEIGVFSMERYGLQSIEDPSGLFISNNLSGNGKSGSVISANLEGTRPVFIEIQSLVVDSHYENGERLFSGFSSKRVGFLISLFEQFLGIALQKKDIFVNVLSGVKAEEPSCDLPLLCSLMSSYTNKGINRNTLIVGEVGLNGEIRSIPQIDIRLSEASRMGFCKAIVPNTKVPDISNISIIKVNTIEDVFESLGLSL